VGGDGDLDVARVVDEAIATSDWSAVHELFDGSFELFEPTRPLEHVRFRYDLVGPRFETADVGKVCTPGWLRWCEREIIYALDRFELGPEERDGLRMTLHLTRRFTARSPLVEELARLQSAEIAARARRMANAISQLGLSEVDFAVGGERTPEWLMRHKPAVLPFADWFSIRLASDEIADDIWRSATCARVCDVCLAMAETAPSADREHWLRLASMSLEADLSEMGKFLATFKPRIASEEERILLAVSNGTYAGDRKLADPERLVAATMARGDFAGAALIRAALQRLDAQNR